MRTFLTSFGMLIGFGLFLCGIAICLMLGIVQFMDFFAGYHIQFKQAFIGLFGGSLIALGGIFVNIHYLKKSTMSARRIFFGLTFLGTGVFFLWMSCIYMPAFELASVFVFLLGAFHVLVGLCVLILASPERIKSIGT